MSKYVKDLITDELQAALDGVQRRAAGERRRPDANEQNVALRKQLRKKNIQLLVVKNSLARRATEGTPLAPAFEGVEGTLAVVWGGDDIVSLAKEVVRLAEDKEFAPFEAARRRDGRRSSSRPKKSKQVSKWPSRARAAQHPGGPDPVPGRELVGAVASAPAAALASQIKQKGEGDEEEAPAEAASRRDRGCREAAGPSDSPSANRWQSQRTRLSK